MRFSQIYDDTFSRKIINNWFTQRYELLSLDIIAKVDDSCVNRQG